MPVEYVEDQEIVDLALDYRGLLTAAQSAPAPASGDPLKIAYDTLMTALDLRSEHPWPSAPAWQEETVPTDPQVVCLALRYRGAVRFAARVLFQGDLSPAQNTATGALGAFLRALDLHPELVGRTL